MLYDPKWEAEVKVDPNSVEGLIAWLEKQPADGTYNWHNCEGLCLIGLYGTAMGMGKKWHDFHSMLFNADILFIASLEPHTFGGALNRARNRHLGRRAFIS